MTADQWKTLHYFKSTENWGDPDKMDFALIQELDSFRDFIKTPLLITRGTNGQHVDGSMHYLGRAADVVFPEVPLSGLFDIWIAAQRFVGFRGIGIYPHWQDAEIVRGGLHLDNRPGNRALWMGVPDGDGQKYVALSAQNLKSWGLV